MADEKDDVAVEDEELPEGDEPESGDESGEDDPAENDLSDDEVKESKALYKLLKDGATRNDTLRVLAERAGVLKNSNPPETKKEEVKARKAIKEVLVEKLGEKYAFIAGPIGDALEEIFAGEREDFNKQLTSVQVQQVDTEVDRALERLATKTKGESRKVEAQMVQLMDSLPKSEKISTFDYLEHIYTIASASRTKGATARQMADKINRNANDAPARLKGSSSTGTHGEAPKKKMTLNESIEFASKKLNLKLK
jgi:hypothetical protein